MPIYQAMVLGVVQGLTEFLPISSTAHLILFPWLLGWKDPGLTFDVALHAGTLLAVLLYFGRLWLELLAAAFGLGDRQDPDLQNNRKLFWLLVISTVPAGIAGLLFESAAETRLRGPGIIGVALIVVALIMWAGDRARALGLGLGQISLADSLSVGVAQALAVIPGVSRSGITMATGLLRRMKRETSARFSFLLSTPMIAGAALKKGMEIHHEGLPPEMRLPFALGMIVSGAVGYLVIAWLIRFLELRTFTVFVVYRVALCVIVLLLGWGWRHP